MNTDELLYIAIGVFVLMLIGIMLTMLEFRRMDEERAESCARREDREPAVRRSA